MQAISKLDIFGVDPVNKLHYGGTEKHKSFIGGLCTLFVVVNFTLILIATAIPIINKTNPTFQSK